MTTRLVIEILGVCALLWFFFSLKFIVGFVAGAILAGEVWAVVRGPK